jgi:fatty-acyl-CoA synthase
VETRETAELERISLRVREAVNRGSAVVLADVHLVGPGWMVKTSSGKNARLANREKYIKEARSQ